MYLVCNQVDFHWVFSIIYVKLFMSQSFDLLIILKNNSNISAEKTHLRFCSFRHQLSQKIIIILLNLVFKHYRFCYNTEGYKVYLKLQFHEINLKKYLKKGS